MLATVLIATGVERLLETRRLSVPLPREASAPGRAPRLDSERMLLDLGILASDRFQGRATDRPGGAMAAQLIATRFEELGLSR